MTTTAGINPLLLSPGQNLTAAELADRLGIGYVTLWRVMDDGLVTASETIRNGATKVFTDVDNETILELHAAARLMNDPELTITFHDAVQLVKIVRGKASGKAAVDD